MVQAIDGFFLAMAYSALCGALAVGWIPLYLPFRKHPRKDGMRGPVRWRWIFGFAAFSAALYVAYSLQVFDAVDPGYVGIGWLIALALFPGLDARALVSRANDLPEPGLTVLRRFSPPIGTILDRRRVLPFDIVSLGGTAGVAAFLFLTKFDVVRGMAYLVETY